MLLKRMTEIGVLAVVLAVIPAQAQTFSDAKSALVDYTKADIAPGKLCETMSQFKAKEIVQIGAALVPAGNAAPEYCRVTGLLDP